MQALSLGMAHQGRVRSAFAADEDARDRAAVEDTAVDQGPAAHPVEIESGSSQPAAGVVRSLSHFRRLRPEADVFTGRRQRDRLSRRRGAARGRKLWRGGMDLSGVYRDSEIRRQLRYHRTLERRRRAGGYTPP